MKIREAIALHVQWKLTFQMQIAMREPLCAELMGKIDRPDRCLVGVWIHSADTLKVRGYREFTDLDREHLRFHCEMAAVAEMINRGLFAEAKRMLANGSKFRLASHDLANAITALGRLAGSAMQPPREKHELRDPGADGLLSSMEGHTTAMPEMPGIARIAEQNLDLYLLPAFANRHGLVAGATGTGKTVTLQVMAEALSAIGVPVFAADVKGDLSGVSRPGAPSAKFDARVEALGLAEPVFAACPVVFWDVFGRQGHPVRATVSEMGPLLLSRILNLNDTQSGVLTLVFKIADDHGLLLLDLKDLQAMLQHVSEAAGQYQAEYGNISAASVGAIQRGLVVLGQQGGDHFFGEPALNIEDLLQVDANGKGVVNILAADELMRSPQLYATFLLWLMSELFEKLPEVGDPDKPKLVFFFDEAHLLFDDLPNVLQGRIEQVVRLIRSKGVGVFFVTQNPIDVPDTVLGQLGNRVQHALRAFSPRDQKAVKAAAQTFRTNPKINVESVITELGVGEALVSFLDEKGIPGIVERAMIRPPHSQIGPITPAQRAALVQSSVLAGVYETAIDRESAYEKLKGKVVASGAATSTAPAGVPGTAAAAGAGSPGWLSSLEGVGSAIGGILQSPAGSRRGDTVVQAMVKSAARTMGSTVGRQIIRGVLGSLMGGGRR